VIHGIITNIKLRTLYNPGLAAVVFIHIPIGIAYLYFIHATSIVSLWDWVIGVVYLFLVAFLLLYKMTYSWMADKNSPYPFSAAEMRRFHIPEKLERLTKKST
jgi:hypothetical protein